MNNEKEIKESIIKYAHRLHEKGMVAGPAGNLSVRAEKVFYVSPHGLPFEEYTPDDIIILDLDSAEILKGKRKPTWELKVHRDIYLTESNIDAIIHVHAPYTIALISGGMEFNTLIPEFVPLGELPTLDYILPAGEELHNAILEAMKKNKNGLLLRNHGFYTFGKTMRDAYYKAELVETASKMALLAKIAGKPRFLTDLEKEKIGETFATKLHFKGTIVDEA